MSSAASDRNLLFGVLALQMDFLGRDALIAAMHAWVVDKTKPLGDILVEQQVLNPDERDLLDALVQKHLDRHRGDVEKSLAAVAVPTPLRDQLRSLADPDVQASIAHLPTPSGQAELGPLPTTVAEVKKIAGLRYQVLRPHDKGGIGEVFLALDQELNRQVALKEIQERHADDPHSLGRFVREAEITGGLEHPGIVPVYGLGHSADGRPYYAMRFIQGETLKDAIARFHAGDAGLTLRGLLTRFIAVCNTLAYAHSRGVIHRDLKPSNIMLGKYGETLVVDWGMAKAGISEPAQSASDGLPEPTLTPLLADGIETQAGAAMGTPAYMSPEQAAGRLDLLGPASDIYSLGATLYTLLTGRPPIEGKDTVDILRKAQRGEWLPPRQVKADVPPTLDAVCRKAMAALPSARYGSALELAADVEHWLADESVSAYRESWAARSRRWMRRHRTLVSTAVGVLVVALLGTTVGLVVVSEAQRQEAEARKTAEANEVEARKQKEEARFNQYVAEMNLVQQEYEAGNLNHVRELLAAHVPRQSDEADFRGFEWHHWQRMSHQELLILEGHTGWAKSGGMALIQGAAFSPDGRRIASGSRGNSVRVWDAVDGRELLCLRGHTNAVCGVAFSPDGQRIASASVDKTVRVWEATTGRELLCLKGHLKQVYGVAFSPEGQRLVSWERTQAKGTGTVRVWDAATGTQLFALPGNAHPYYSGVALSPDGRRITCGSHDNIVRVWDAVSGRELHSLKGHTGIIYSATFSPDGRRLASLDSDGEIRVWDTSGGQELLVLKVGRSSSIRAALSFSPDSRRLVALGADRSVQVWDTANGRRLPFISADGNSDPLEVMYSPNGRRLVSWDLLGALRVYDAANGRELFSFKGHTGAILKVTYSPDSRRLASVGYDGVVRVWDAASGPEPLVIKDGGRAFNYSNSQRTAFSPDGQRLASPGSYKTVLVRDAATGQELLCLQGHMGDVFCVAFSPDGRQLASGGEDKMVRVWDASSGKEQLCLKGHAASIDGLAYSPDGRRLASMDTGETVRVWDAATGQELLTFKGGALCLAFSPDGRRMASINRDKRLGLPTVRICDATSGQELLVLHRSESSGDIYEISFSPDGRRLASAHWDGTVRIWDTVSGREPLVLRGHVDSALGVAYNPDGRRLASVDVRGTVRVWDAIGGRELLSFKRQGLWGATNVAFSPDGRRLASHNGAGIVRVWEAAPASAEVSRRRALVSDVEELFDALLFREKVADALRRDAALNEADRAFALSVAQTHSEHAGAWNDAAWNVVKVRDSGEDAYTRALRYAEAAVHLAPEDGEYLNTLGVAQYRVGRYADALATLTKSEKLNATKEGSIPDDLAFLAMTQHQLGKKDEAKATLARLREVMKQPRWAQNAEAQGFLREAEQLIEGKVADQKP
jgi:WD40 repeat protein